MPIPITYQPPKREFKKFPVITPGIYKVKIGDIELLKDKPNFKDPTILEDKYKFEFDILEGEFAGQKVWRETSTSLNPGYKGQPSTLYTLFCAAYRCVLTDDEAQSVSVADVNSLVGKEINVAIVNKQSGENTYSNVKDVFSAQTGASRGWEQIQNELPSQQEPDMFEDMKKEVEGTNKYTNKQEEPSIEDEPPF